MKIKKFRTSQWIMAVIIICLAQLLIHYFSVQVMSGSEVINYVSFAGTIVSIILAVLAIVYSFYQSFTQQNNVDSISREVEKLKKTAKNIDASSDAISTATECLPRMLRELESLPSIVSASVASQVKEQTGVLLGAHATDLKSFMADSISKSADSLVSANSSVQLEEHDSSEDLQLDTTDLITVTCAAAAYLIITGGKFSTLASLWGGIFDSRTYQAIASGVSSIHIAFIMAGDLTIDKASRSVRVSSLQDDYESVGSFVTYAIKELRDINPVSVNIVNRFRETFSEIPSSDDEIIDMINKRIQPTES
ncbi:hypothetical protein [Aeromonas salmonicida]